MAKSVIEAKHDQRLVQAGPPPLSSSVRRHLGTNLRKFYADSLTAPVSERMESLLARLEGPKG